MVCDKVRIRFQKVGDLRLVSHHDLMRCWERMLRRADLPFHSTQGFNPKPRLVFALSLGLGIVGREEVIELELDAELAPEEVLDRLRRQAPPGLELFDARRIDKKTTAHVRRVGYRMAIPPARADAAVPQSQKLLAAAEVWVERSRPTARRVNIRPYLDAIRVLNDSLELDLIVTPTGTARPDELLQLLGLGDLLAEGGVLERTRVELDDEVEQTLPVNTVAEPRPPQAHQGESSAIIAKRLDEPAEAAPRPSPLLPGPLDF